MHYQLQTMAPEFPDNIGLDEDHFHESEENIKWVEKLCSKMHRL